MKPITVLIPVYNAEKFLQEAIDSVLCQTFTDFDVLVIDDGSTDNSPAIARSYTDPRVKYIACPHDFINTLNKGLELSDSKYIALIGHDDRMISCRLQTQYDFMEANPEIAACGGYTLSFGTYSRIEEKIPLEHQEIIQTMLLYCPILNPTGFIRRKVLTDNHIRYKRGYSYSTDYKLWSEIAQNGKLANIPKILTLYRVHNEQTSVKYREKCMKGGQKVKMEMLNYFLSQLKAGDELVDIMERDFIPAIDDLGEMGILSEELFFPFMYELIVGLKKRGVIEI